MSKKPNDINQELKEIKSILADHDLDNELNVPVAYFETLEREIMIKTVLDARKGKLISASWIKYAASIAAVSAVVFFGLKLFGPAKNESLENRLASMDDIELNNFINVQIASISTDEFHEYISDNINEISAGLFEETEFIDTEMNQRQLIENMNLEILADENGEATEPLLNEEQIKQIDDDVIEQLLYEESMYDDIGL